MLSEKREDNTKQLKRCKDTPLWIYSLAVITIIKIEVSNTRIENFYMNQ